MISMIGKCILYTIYFNSTTIGVFSTSLYIPYPIKYDADDAQGMN